EKIEFEGTRAVAVRWRQNGAIRSARARGEIILAAGAIGSVQILKLSGVGGADELTRLGIPVVLDKPGVGENLQDHLQLRLIYKVTGAKTLNETYRSLIGHARMGVDYGLFRHGPLTMALAKYEPSEYLPGARVGDDDAALIKAAGDIGTTIFHPVGTAKMGRPSDSMAVVDERVRVIGLERLRVVDASVMPAITSGNTNAPTMMIAEKGAAMIIEDRRG